MRSVALVLLILLFLVGACANTIGSETKSAPLEPTSQDQDTLAQEPANFYYDFNDIPIPKEMKLVPDSSLMFETVDIKAGVIFFEGRVDPVPLFDFFIDSMPKESWRLRSYFKYGRYIIVFEKPDKDCIISINRKTLTTQLEVWVTPRSVKQ